MTRDDIIRMAQEADDFADSYTPQYVTLPNEWQEIRDKRFAALVAAAEREACAKVVEKCPWPRWVEGTGARSLDAREVFADAIRARGQQ